MEYKSQIILMMSELMPSYDVHNFRKANGTIFMNMRNDEYSINVESPENTLADNLKKMVNIIETCDCKFSFKKIKQDDE